jgi:cis-3-alkyl-4-acyloxetan-2-one decarboxylase
MIPPDETFDGTFPFKPHFTEAPGFRMHYVDEGTGSPILLLHGEPTWGYLYRNMISPLARRYRVIVPDQMGFGKSETPTDRPYTLRSHVENLAALIDALDLQELTLFGQDWAGPIITAYTIRHPNRVRRLFYANTINGHSSLSDPTLPQLGDSPWFQWLAAGLETGRTEAMLRHVGSSVLTIMKILGFQRSEVVTESWLRAYQAPFSTVEAAIGAHAWPMEALSGSFVPYITEGITAHGLDHLRAKPAMLAEGLEDRAILPALAIASFRALWPHGPVVELPGVGHYSQEDAPDVLVALLDQFIQLR